MSEFKRIGKTLPQGKLGNTSLLIVDTPAGLVSREVVPLINNPKRCRIRKLLSEGELVSVEPISSPIRSF